MRTSSPEKLLKLLLPSLQTQHADLGIVLNHTAFRLSFVKRTAAELHYRLDIIESDKQSDFNDERVVKSELIKACLTRDVNLVYSQLASFLVNAIPLYVMERENIKSKFDVSMVLSDLYILEKRRIEMHYTISLLDGKYTYVLDQKGQRALRYGEFWRDLTGDKFIHSMAMKIEDLDYKESRLRLFIENLIVCSIDEKVKDDAKKLLERMYK